MNINLKILLSYKDNMEKGQSFLKIIWSFYPYFWRTYTIQDICKLSQLSREPVHRHLQALVKQGIITKVKRDKQNFFITHTEAEARE